MYWWEIPQPTTSVRLGLEVKLLFLYVGHDDLRFGLFLSLERLGS